MPRDCTGVRSARFVRCTVRPGSGGSNTRTMLKVIPTNPAFDRIRQAEIESINRAYERQLAQEERKRQEAKQARDNFVVGTRPPVVAYPERPKDWSDSRWERKKREFEKTHEFVKQEHRFGVDEKKNYAWVNAQLWKKFVEQHPRDPFNLPALNVPHTGEHWDPNSLSWVKDNPTPQLEKPSNWPNGWSKRSWMAAFSKPWITEEQNPKIADGRPGGKKGAARRLATRMSSTPEGQLWLQKERELAAAKELAAASKGSSRPSVPIPIAPPPMVLPVAETTIEISRKPQIRSTGDKCFIRHQELLGSLKSKDVFTLLYALAVNPGLSSTFPFLSTQVTNWERYRFRKLVFHFITKTNYTMSGSVILAPDYDANEQAPTTEQIMFTYAGAKETQPYRSMSITLDPSRLHPAGPKLVRQGPVATGSSVIDYDAATFYVFANDGATADNGKLLGKLWVEYDVELTISQANPSGFASGAYWLQTGSSPTTAANFGTGPTVVQSATLVSVSGNVITSNVEGALNIQLATVSATSATGSAPTPSAGSSLSAYGYAGGAGTTSFVQTYQWKATVGATLTFANTIVGGSGAALLVSSVQAYPT